MFVGEARGGSQLCQNPRPREGESSLFEGLWVCVSVNNEHVMTRNFYLFIKAGTSSLLGNTLGNT